ncbi:hypothetical protein BCR35DRAFT_310904 [Leucosporidium creatinivorum]|uniref:Uncharacterized protein n=1 Tax=Leucosporidium creatinivorum TaxID=106004 RepID=A0A1Y2CKL7_9BASI|nr:hypothetical protein BCR35DRAFT_310904 [Leucosporidium creatinivorum]
MDNTTTHPSTTAYLSTLSLLLTPHPQLSASASHSLASRKPLAPAALDTKCSACLAELVGGLNAAFWVEGGSLWARCESCGWASRRGGAEGAETVQSGKGRFERVKKRRRVAAEVVQRSTAGMKGLKPNLSPIHSRAEPGATASPKPSPKASRTASTFPPPSSRPSPAPPAASSTAPPTIARSLPSSRLASPSSAAPSARPSPSPAPSAPSSARASPSPSLSSNSDTSATTKKRKRSKQQPSGLAELLEAKRKEKAVSAAGGGGAGLMDFLQGI